MDAWIGGLRSLGALMGATRRAASNSQQGEFVSTARFVLIWFANPRALGGLRVARRPWADSRVPLIQHARDADRADGAIEPALQGREIRTRFNARIVELARNETAAL